MDTTPETPSFATELGQETVKAVVATAAVTAVSMTMYLIGALVWKKYTDRRTRKAESTTPESE